MAGYDQAAMDAAKKMPSERSTTEQQLVDKQSGFQDIRNADFYAKQAQSRG